MIMSEIKKNIETCRGEDVLAEVSGLPQDPHFGSLVNEAFDPMQQQALHQAGYDGYSEVIAQHKPYTFASAIIQMKSNLLLLLRALWQFPFGRGTLRSLSDDASPRSLSDDASLRSLADMWQHYITRLSGNETYGIPSRLSSLTDLPSAPLLVADRKISGVPDAVDGLSLLHLLMTDNAYTVLNDDNEYTITKSLPLSYFPSVETFNFGDNVDLGISTIISGYAHDVLTVHGLRKQATQSAFDMFTGSFKKLYCDIREIDGAGILFEHATIEEMYLPRLEKANCIISWNASGWWNNCSPNITTIQAPKLKEVTANYGTGINAHVYKSCLIGAQCPLITSLEFEELESISGNLLGGSSCPNITELRMPKLRSVTGKIVYGNQANRASLALIEVGAMETNLDLSWWNPTDKGETFLQNFRTYIALRLTTFASNGPTLTLSQAVCDAIKDESHLFVFDEGTMTIYAYLTNIKHWTVTK
jgi:hypothetical protein